MVEIPSWAWGILLSVLGGGSAAITSAIMYYARRLEQRLDAHDRRLEEHAVALARLDARLEGRAA